MGCRESRKRENGIRHFTAERIRASRGCYPGGRSPTRTGGCDVRNDYRHRHGAAQLRPPRRPRHPGAHLPDERHHPGRPHPAPRAVVDIEGCANAGWVHDLATAAAGPDVQRPDVVHRPPSCSSPLRGGPPFRKDNRSPVFRGGKSRCANRVLSPTASPTGSATNPSSHPLRLHPVGGPRQGVPSAVHRVRLGAEGVPGLLAAVNGRARRDPYRVKDGATAGKYLLRPSGTATLPFRACTSCLLFRTPASKRSPGLVSRNSRCDADIGVLIHHDRPALL